MKRSDIRWLGWAGIGLWSGGLRPGKFFTSFFLILFQISNLVLLNYFAGFELMSSHKINLGYALTQHLVSGYN
jgi:hypothetical protein